MDWSCSANVTCSSTQSCPQMDPHWPQEERQTQRDLEEDCREGNERTGVDLGHGGTLKGVQQTDLGGELWWQPYAHCRVKRLT